MMLIISYLANIVTHTKKSEKKNKIKLIAQYTTKKIQEEKRDIVLFVEIN